VQAGPSSFEQARVIKARYLLVGRRSGIAVFV
jgi:hypothetical protein